MAPRLLVAMHAFAFSARQPTCPAAGDMPIPAVRSVIEERRRDAPVQPSSDAGARGAMYERAATDGQLEEEGVVQLLELLDPPASAVFADLGSGRGEALFHIAARREMSRAVGVELLRTRHERACELRQKLEAQKLLRTPVSLVQGDLLDMRESVPGAADETFGGIHDVTHAFTCSVCFDDVILRSVARTLGSRELCPHFQVLVSMRELPVQPYLQKIGELPLSCSWNSMAISRVYVPTDILARPVEDCSIPVLARFLCANGHCSLPRGLGSSRSSPLIRLHS